MQYALFVAYMCIAASHLGMIRVQYRLLFVAYMCISASHLGMIRVQYALLFVALGSFRDDTCAVCLVVCCIHVHCCKSAQVLCYTCHLGRCTLT